MSRKMKLVSSTCMVLASTTSACGAPENRGDLDAAAPDGAIAGDSGLGIDAALDGGDPCAGIDEIAAKIYLCFVIHNEEDDANGVPGSMPNIPDYNGDQATFDHFADAMYDYAVMLNSHGATLGFQPDWTFTEGVASYRPEFFEELLALGTVR